MKHETKIKALAVVLFPVVAALVGLAIVLAMRQERKNAAYRRRLADLATRERLGDGY